MVCINNNKTEYTITIVLNHTVLLILLFEFPLCSMKKAKANPKLFNPSSDCPKQPSKNGKKELRFDSKGERDKRVAPPVAVEATKRNRGMHQAKAKTGKRKRGREKAHLHKVF